MQPYPRRFEELLLALTDHDVTEARYPSHNCAIVDAMLAQDAARLVQIARLHLDDGAQLLGE